jgi:hypothetical protein
MGIAMKVQEQTGMTYLAGMWKEQLRDQLHWSYWLSVRSSTGSELPRPLESRAPSWSWIAIEKSAPVLLPTIASKAAPGTKLWHVEVLDVNCLLDSSRQMWKGTLELQCENIISTTRVYVPQLSKFEDHKASSAVKCPGLKLEIQFDYNDDSKQVFDAEKFLVQCCSYVN